MSDIESLDRSFVLGKDRSRKNILSTRSKLRVLSALNAASSSSQISNEIPSFESNSDHQKKFEELCKNEGHYIKDMECLQNLLQKPLLKENVADLDNILMHVSDIIEMHKNFVEELSSGQEYLAYFFLKMLPQMSVYKKYSVLVDMDIESLKKFSSIREENLLLEPVRQIHRYERLFKSLSDIAPMEYGYKDIFDSIVQLANDIEHISNVRKNAFKMLRIQKLLVDRQPRIFSADRWLRKEGFLYKLSRKGNHWRKRVFFLFNDIFICCKTTSKRFDWKEPSSLQCRTLMQLRKCSVHFVLGESERANAFFKVTCGNYTCMLHSKDDGESQLWVKEIQSAIDQFQMPSRFPMKESRLFNLKRSSGVKHQSPPLIYKRSVASSEQLKSPVLDQSQELDKTVISPKRKKCVKLFLCSNNNGSLQ